MAIGGGKKNIGWYARIFLSTRNGLFFAFPLMCVGEMAGKAKASMHKLLITTILLFAEITFVGAHVFSSADRSMYFLLPLFTLFFVSAVREWNPKIPPIDLAGYSCNLFNAVWTDMGWQQGAWCVASYRFILELGRLYFGFDRAGRFLLSD